MKFWVRSIVAVNGLGAVRAIQRDRPCRFLGIPFPGTPLQHAMTVGSPMSAPPLMLGALLVGAQRGRHDVVGLLSAMFLVGILSEPDTWETLRQPRSDPLSTVCAASEIALPTLLLTGTLLAISRKRDTGTP